MLPRQWLTKEFEDITGEMEVIGILQKGFCFLILVKNHYSSDGETMDFAKKWNNLAYCRLSKMVCGFKDQVRARPSGETGGLRPAPAPVILVRNAG